MRNNWLAAALILVALALMTLAANPVPQSAADQTPSGAHHVGSQACGACHPEIYARWKKTPMANVVRDPREHPDAILPDLSKPDSLVKFNRDQIALVYGSVWKQRYFTKIGDGYYLFPAQWDVRHRVWRRYFVENGTDWWAAFYPPDNMKRPTGPLCDGCHSVGYDIHTNRAPLARPLALADGVTSGRTGLHSPETARMPPHRRSLAHRLCKEAAPRAGRNIKPIRCALPPCRRYSSLSPPPHAPAGHRRPLPQSLATRCPRRD